MYKDAQKHKPKASTCLQIAVLAMAIMLVSGFLATIPIVQAMPANSKSVTAVQVMKTAPLKDKSATTIPVVQAAPPSDEATTTIPNAEVVLSNTKSTIQIPVIKTDSVDKKTPTATPVVQAVPSSEDSMVLTFTVKINKTEVDSFLVSIAKPKSFDENTTSEMADQIQLTEEQKTAIREASTVEIMADSESYMVVEHLMSWYFIAYGAYCHLHLSAIDARNYDTAINVAIGLFVLLSALLLLSIIGPVVTACITFAILILKVDYEALYNGDRNSDNSFDTWFEISYNEMYSVYKFMRTPHYLWFVSAVGAYIWSESEHGSSVGAKHTGMGGGGRLYAR